MHTSDGRPSTSIIEQWFVTCSKTLGEFKRTHEQAGLLEVKRVLSSDQWEAIQGIASPASYFA